jgi:hypothetical protein
LQGKEPIVNKDEAVKLAQQGSPVVLMVGTGKSAKVYFILNADGTFAGEKLAKLGNSKKLESRVRLKKSARIITSWPT